MMISEDVSGDEATQAESALGEKMSEKEALDAQITEKLAMLDAVQSDLDRMNRGGSSTMMIVFVSLLGVLVIVLVVVLVIMIMGNRQRPQLPPPWMYPPRPRKKKSEHEPLKTPQSSPPPLEDTSVLQSEISDMRQAVVSMSVSQPSTATRIVKEWMEDDTPPPEPEPVVASVEPEDEDSGKKKKKKKK
jgi:flagellar biosynthesis/type III secretory pathway M-ring protein FliF/YscJ